MGRSAIHDDQQLDPPATAHDGSFLVLAVAAAILLSFIANWLWS